MSELLESGGRGARPQESCVSGVLRVADGGVSVSGRGDRGYPSLGPQAWLPVRKSGHEQKERDDCHIHSDLRYHRQSNAG